MDNGSLKENPLTSEEPAEFSDAVAVQTTAVDRERYPDLGGFQNTVLKDGKRARKEAKYTTILNRHTQEVHHHALSIETSRKLQGSWQKDDVHSITLTDEGEDEIQKLLLFLQTAHGNNIQQTTSDYVILPTPAGITDADALQGLINNLSKADQVLVLCDILEFAAKDTELLKTLVDRVSQDRGLFADAAAAMNLATYTSAVNELKEMVNTNAGEAQFQNLLTDNPWMFGSEYSELLTQRKWTRNEQQDFVVRRTADGYIEIIEIKTTLDGRPLFIHDSSHDSYYQSADLSKVIGQVQLYLEKLDLDRVRIMAVDKEDTNKIRAKIIIGRDGDQNQQIALRRINGHLHRIEILTFDQLVRIAENVLSYLQRVLKPQAQWVIDEE